MSRPAQAGDKCPGVSGSGCLASAKNLHPSSGSGSDWRVASDRAARSWRVYTAGSAQLTSPLAGRSARRRLNTCQGVVSH